MGDMALLTRSAVWLPDLRRLEGVLRSDKDRDASPGVKEIVSLETDVAILFGTVMNNK